VVRFLPLIHKCSFYHTLHNAYVMRGIRAWFLLTIAGLPYSENAENNIVSLYTGLLLCVLPDLRGHNIVDLSCCVFFIVLLLVQYVLCYIMFLSLCSVEMAEQIRPFLAVMLSLPCRTRGNLCTSRSSGTFLHNAKNG